MLSNQSLIKALCRSPPLIRGSGVGGDGGDVGESSAPQTPSPPGWGNGGVAAGAEGVLREKLILDLPSSANHSLGVYAEVAAQHLNHRLRPCLKGKTSCQVFFSLGERPIFLKWERREIYDILRERVEEILASMNQLGRSAREAAWRIAVGYWLQSRRFIKVHIPRKCHPILPPFFAPE
jgi:hypothetical protein